MLFQSGQTIIFVGDSITNAGRTDGEGPLGSGYVSLLHNFLLARYPEKTLRILNRGVSGDTVQHLANRWVIDVLSERPDWLVVKIGVNDAWRAIDDQLATVHVEEYEVTLHDLLSRARAVGCRLLLVTPFLVETDPNDPARRHVGRFINAAERVGAALDVPVVQLQPAFDQVLRERPPATWSLDRVHPTAAGHALIALNVMRAVAFEL